MRTSLSIIVFVATLFTSCSRYQYVTISGSDIKKNDKQEFIVENDSIRIQYNFNGPDAPINLTIENKLSIPVYIDWQQSALIINDKAISYVPNTVPIEAAFQGTGVNWISYNPGRYSTTSGTLNAKAILPDKLDFIPPRSYITKNPMGLTNQIIPHVADSTFHREKLTLIDGSFAATKHASFTETSTPLRFKSYLTLLFGEQSANPMAYQHSFYISEIYSTVSDPESFWFNGSEHRGNQYYVKETTGFGKGFGIVAGVAVLTTVAALEQKTGEKAKQ